jgi:ATP synthase I chain
MTSQIPPAGDDFYSRALERIQTFMLVLGTAALITACIFFGWRIGMGFALGATIAYLNFHWLKKVVTGLADLTIGSGTPASSRGVVHRFLLRYFLMAIVAFVILTVSRESLYGLFAGLFLPVAAILCETAYEAYAALTRRT